MKNILIVNQPINNRGDESAHKGLVRSLLKYNNEHNINIETLFIGAKQDSINQFMVLNDNVSYINLKNIKGLRYIKLCLIFNIFFFLRFFPQLSALLRIVKRADVVVCAPGGICMGGFQSWDHIFLLYVAKYFNKPIVYYGRSFGPFPKKTLMNRIFKKRSYELLKYFSFLSIRDSVTQELADKIGLKYTKTVDSAFLDNPTEYIPKSISNLLDVSDYIVIVPNLLNWHYKYKDINTSIVVEFFVDIVKKTLLRYPECKIVMLPQTFNYGSYNGDDIHFFRDIANELSDSRVVVIDDIYSSDIQQSVIKKAKFLVGARYHSVVFAINNNTPFIALSYEHKISGLLESVNLKDTMIDITTIFNSEQLIKEAIEKYDEMIVSIGNCNISNVKAKTIAEKCFTNLLYYLDNNKTYLSIFLMLNSLSL